MIKLEYGAADDDLLHNLKNVYSVNVLLLVETEQYVLHFVFYQLFNVELNSFV